MNERIAEILEQAFDLCNTYDDEGKTGLIKTTEAFNKFAELIIKECIQQGKLVQTEDIPNASPEYLLGREMGIEVYMNRIKEHFGVE